MRYVIEMLNNGKWQVNDSLFKRFINKSDDLSKITKSIVDCCKSNPAAISRYNLRLFDNNIYEWVFKTEVEYGFIPFKDPICILWNNNLPFDHPSLELKDN